MRLIERSVEQEKSQFEDQVDKNRPNHFGSAPLTEATTPSTSFHPGLGRWQERAPGVRKPKPRVAQRLVCHTSLTAWSG